MNKNGQTLPIVLVWMAFFLGGSLMISAVVNYYNRRLKLVER
jgi:ABC-type amino acid transport system permease subunit